MRAARMLVRVALVAVFACRLMASPAAVQEDTTTTNQVEVRLIKELTFDSEIQILRLKDGLPRLVVTEKTINWLDREGGVETSIPNPTRPVEELQAEYAEGGESSLTSNVFASQNGEWVAIIDRELRRQLGLSANLRVRLLDASGREIARFPIESLCDASVSNDGRLIAVHSVRLGDERIPAPSRFVLYDRAGRKLLNLPLVDAAGEWASKVFVAFTDDSRYLAVAPMRSPTGPLTVYFVRGDGAVAWSVALNGSYSTRSSERSPMAVSRDGSRILVSSSTDRGVDVFHTFDAEGISLGEPIQEPGFVYKLTANSALTRVLLLSGTTLRCIEIDSAARESWVWPSPWSPHRERIIDVQWTYGDELAVVRTRFDPEFTETRPLPPDSAIVLDQAGRELWQGRLSTLGASPGQAREETHDDEGLFCIKDKATVGEYQIQGIAD